MAHTPPGRTRARVLRFVKERLLEGRPPTVREVQQAMGFRAVESARAHLRALVAEGKIEQDPGAARGFRLPWSGGMSGGTRPAVFVPVLGRVQAGGLTAAVEDPEGYVAVEPRGSDLPAAPGEPARDGALFALRVRGDSMRGAAILDGDLVVVRRQERADDGRIVVAMVDGPGGAEATVKTLRIRRGRGRGDAGGPAACDGDLAEPSAQPFIELHPENPDFPVIVPPPGSVQILGVVIEVRRSLGHDTAARRGARG
ncbi:MAG: LexA repressor [Planctomycetes bacterium]|nr:LexA repressor [Planctomycetota bacterium]